MTRLPHQFIEDRELRDAARAVFLADLEHAKGALSRKGLLERLTGPLSKRVSLGLKDTMEVAAAGASANRSGIAALVAALIVWFSRDTILEWVGVETGETEDEPDLASPGQSANVDADAAADHPASNPAPCDATRKLGS
ncbi:MAG: hypothetical protein V2I27_07855 [Erythrobacter sp.]|jgi:hypothetical protein|nr:hypothetical protein [Erythrobacter sp.]